MDIFLEHYKLLKKAVPFQRWNWRAFRLIIILKTIQLQMRKNAASLLKILSTTFLMRKKLILVNQNWKLYLGITSIRKHQQMIKVVLGNALNLVLVQESEDVV